MKESGTPISVGFYDDNGNIKPKEQFLKELETVYDNISDSSNGPQFMDIFTNPEEDFCPANVLEKYQFIERKLYLDAEIVETTGKKFLERIQFWNAEDEFNDTPVDKRIPIQIYIDSPGGLVTTSLEIIDAIHNSKTPVYTIVTGTAYSGAFFITIAGHKRMAFKNSTFLFHEGSGGALGDAHKVLQQSAFYKDLLKQLRKHVIKSTKITNEMYTQHEKDDWYFDAKKALKFGVIDEICTDVNGGIYNEE